MLVCLDCMALFENPATWEEKHGFDYGPYEQFSGCPFCGGAYTKTYRCDVCGEYITDKYIKIGHERYCDDCYITYELGDEL